MSRRLGTTCRSEGVKEKRGRSEKRDEREGVELVGSRKRETAQFFVSLS